MSCTHAPERGRLSPDCADRAEQQKLHREMAQCSLVENRDYVGCECNGCHFEDRHDCPRTVGGYLECDVRGEAAGWSEALFRHDGVKEPPKPEPFNLPALVAKHERSLEVFGRLCREVLELNPQADKAMRSAYGKLLTAFQEELG